MRLLRLTNSYDTDPAIAEDANKKTLVESLFQQATGEPMETIVRVVWPDPVLPELIDKWLKRYQPDVVLLVVSSYWFTYVSAPARIQRTFGRVGKPIADASRPPVRPGSPTTRPFACSAPPRCGSSGAAPGSPSMK